MHQPLLEQGTSVHHPPTHRPSRWQGWLSALLLAMLPLLSFAQTATIGSTAVPAVSPATSSYFYGPLYRSSATSTFYYSRYAHVYTPAELNIPAGSIITELAWLKGNDGTISGANTFNVLLANTSTATLATGTTWGTVKTGATQVYSSSSQAVTGAAGTYFTVPLNGSFVYTGGNLLVLMDWAGPGPSSGVVNFITNAATGQAIGYADSDPMDDATTLNTGSYGNRRPTLRVSYTPATPCTAPPTAGTAIASVSSVCAGTPASLSVQGASFGLGMTYQWQQSTDGTTYTNIAGATNTSYTSGPLTQTTYFRIVLTCSGQSANSVAAQVSVSAPTYATLPALEDFEADWVDGCATRDQPNNSWRMKGGSDVDASWRRNDDGASAGWTSPTFGAYTPTGSAGSARSARFHSSYATDLQVGTLDYYVNLSAPGAKNMMFDYINTSGDDSLTVHLSTDGGATFGPALLALTTVSTWTPQMLTLNSTSATSVIRFRGVADFGSTDIGIDNLQLAAGNCAVVTGLNASSTAPTTATVSFVAGANNSGYTITYTAQGGTPQTVNATSSPVTLTGLTPNTPYSVRVVATCAGGLSSFVVGTSFTTTCTVIPYATLPYQQGFENTWASVCDTLNVPSVNWRATPNTGNNSWRRDDQGSFANWTSNNGLYSPTGSQGSARSARFHSYNASSNTIGILDLFIDLSGPGNKLVNFDYINTSGADSLRVMLSTDGGATFGPALLALNQASTWTPQTLTLNTTSATAVIRFRARSDFGTTDIGLDNLVIESASGCLLPLTLSATNVGGTSATLNWDARGAGGTFTVEYGPVGFTPGTGTTVTGITGNSTTISGLSSVTSYQFYVTRVCATGGTATSGPVTFTTRPANDDCSTAQMLTANATCTPTSGSVFQASDSQISTLNCSGTTYADDDVWYSFVATNTAHDIRMQEGTGFDGVIQLFNGNCNLLSNNKCVDLSPTAGGAIELLEATGLTVGQTYYFRIFSQSNTAPTMANGSFTVCVTPPTPAPANDNCDAAQSLTVNATCTPTTGTVYRATASPLTVPSGTCTGTPDDDVWYSFVATGVSHDILVDEGTGLDAVVQVLSGASCTSLTSMACIDASASGGDEKLRVGGLTVGSTYFVRVYSFPNTAQTITNSSFTICVTPSPQPPANDLCANAVNLPVQFGANCSSPLEGNNSGASGDSGVPNPTCGTANYAGGDVWYKVTVPPSGALKIETGNGSTSPLSDTDVAVYAGNCGALTAVQCQTAGGSNSHAIVNITGRTPGETLYVRVWEPGNNAEGTFVICATSPTTCQAPSALLATNILDTSATLTWAGSQSATATFTVEYGPVGFTPGTGTKVAGITAQSLALTGLTADTEYCFYVTEFCSPTSNPSPAGGPLCFRTNATVANNEPCGATALTIGGAPITGTNAGATFSSLPGISMPAPCAPASSPRDVWFSVALPANSTTMGMNLSGASTGMVRLYTAASCSTGFSLVECRAANGANQSVGTVSFTGLTGGATYYVAVSGFGNGDTQGNYSIEALVLGTRNSLPVGAELSVFPNPTSTGKLTLKLTGLGKVASGHVQLLNALGQKVRQQDMTLRGGAAELTLPTTGLARGMYTLQMSVGDHIVTRKVMVD
ncbi:fibronectin type III domain-containing protein [Hymenobacter sp. B81]|uniref:fibronectin type III domain-containing protein n=1 Tax=Hymenobacter sp. B81 TaxID=3344878 RepID=UPI0037DDBB97